MGMLEKIRKKYFHFLWMGKKEKDGMELVKIANPNARCG